MLTLAILFLAIDILEYVLHWPEHREQTAANHEGIPCWVECRGHIPYISESSSKIYTNRNFSWLSDTAEANWKMLTRIWARTFWFLTPGWQSQRIKPRMSCSYSIHQNDSRNVQNVGCRGLIPCTRMTIATYKIVRVNGLKSVHTSTHGVKIESNFSLGCSRNWLPSYDQGFGRRRWKRNTKGA